MRRLLARAAGGGLLLAIGLTAMVAASPPASPAVPRAVVSPVAAPRDAAAPTSCHKYPPSKPTITLSSSIVVAGATLTVSGNGFLPGGAVTLTLEPGGVLLATVTATGDGTFSVQVTIPSSTPPGQYKIVAAGRGCNGGGATVFSLLTVVPVSTTTTTGKPLPFTGADVALPIGIGFALLAIGLVAVLIGRRRPRTAGRS